MVEKLCCHCGVNFHIRETDSRRGRGKYCSLKCSYLGRAKGPVVLFNDLHFSVNNKGYFINRSKGKFLHTAIWEKHCCLVPTGYVVHHINHGKKDNHINNLMMIRDVDHKKLHRKLRFIPKDDLGRYAKEGDKDHE